MFCDIEVDYKKNIDKDQLQAALNPLIKTGIVDLAEAYKVSELLSRERPLDPLFAFRYFGCIVIVLDPSLKSVHYHLEGYGTAFNVGALFQTAEKFSRELLEIKNASYTVKRIGIQVKQGLGGETGIAGKVLSFWPAMQERISFKDLRGSLVTFVTALVLIWLGLSTALAKAAYYSLGIALIYTVLEALIGYILSHGKIKWIVKAG